MAQTLILKQVEENIIKKLEEGRNMSRELAALRTMETDSICKSSSFEVSKTY
jgi:hypothetical protein